MSVAPIPGGIRELWYFAVREGRRELSAHFTRLPFAVNDAIKDAMADEMLKGQFTNRRQIISPLIEIDKPYHLSDVYIGVDGDDDTQRYHITKIVMAFASGVASVFRLRLQDPQGVRVETGRAMHNVALMFVEFAMADIFEAQEFLFLGANTKELLDDGVRMKTLLNVDEVLRARPAMEDSDTETEPPSSEGSAASEKQEIIDVDWSD